MKTTYDFSQGKRGAVIPTTGKICITIHVDIESLRQVLREELRAA
jgi:hypothetical protein